MYITFKDYEEYGGKTVTDIADFDRLEAKAWYKLDMRTQGRIKEPLENIKRLMVELIDLENDMCNLNVKQVSNDGVAVTYRDTMDYTQRFEDLVSSYAGKFAWRGIDEVSTAS